MFVACPDCTSLLWVRTVQSEQRSLGSSFETWLWSSGWVEWTRAGEAGVERNVAKLLAR